ncbi:MAG: hypothetical protein ABIQ95_12610 [Bdellovibrionia bacterium]
MKFHQYISLTLILTHMAYGETAPDLEESIQLKISEIENGLSSAQYTESNEESWYFQNFWLRVRLPLGFSIPSLVNFQIIPELELLFRRDIPAGWQKYHP